MKVIKSNDELKYKRKLECFGEGLVLFQIRAHDESVGANYHLFYKNEGNLPLDVAINIRTLNIEYIKYFSPDEKIVERKINNRINLFEDNIKIVDYDFSDKKFEENIEMDFDFIRVDNDIIVLAKNMKDEIYGYKLNEDNYILCDVNNNIVGVLMKRFSSMELKILKESKIFDDNLKMDEIEYLDI